MAVDRTRDDALFERARKRGVATRKQRHEVARELRAFAGAIEADRLEPPMEFLEELEARKRRMPGYREHLRRKLGIALLDAA
jgi:hypothetical protein